MIERLPTRAEWEQDGSSAAPAPSKDVGGSAREARGNRALLVAAYVSAVLLPVIGILAAFYAAVSKRTAAIRRHAIAIAGVSLLAAGGYVLAITSIVRTNQESEVATHLRSLLDAHGVRYTDVSDCYHHIGNQYVCRVTEKGQQIVVAVTDNGKTIHEHGIGAGDDSSSEDPSGISPVQLVQPLAQYTRYASATLTKLRTQLATLNRKLRARDVAGAQSAWRSAHVSWLVLGQDNGAYGAFGSLGNQIDGTADGHVGTTSSQSFTGFHRVELDLWRRHDAAAARTHAATLTKLVGSINDRALSQDLPDTTDALDSWALRCHEILEDALRDTLSGNDDYGSHTGLAAIRADVTATREMLRVLGDLIEPRAPALVPTATRELAAIDAAASPPRAVPIATLPERRRKRINAAVGAALETLAPVSELMTNS
jgi:high-affinity iron transporter